MEGVIVYSLDVDRWAFLGDNEVHFYLKCGQCFEIRMFDRYRSCRLEYNENWYVVFEGISFILLHPFIYQVRCD